MSKKNTKSTPANAVENTSINAHPATAPVAENIPAAEIMPEPIPTEEKDVITKEYKPTLKDGAKSVSVETAPEWAAQLPGIVTFESKIPDANTSGQTLYSLTVETDSKVYHFINATVTAIKNVFGLAPIQSGAKVKLAVKTDEELSAEVEKIFSKGVEFINRGVELLNSYADGTFAAVNTDGVKELMMAAAKMKNEEIRARVQAARDAEAARAAERAAKEAERAAAAALKEAKAADKARAAAVLSLDEIQKQMFDAMQRKDWAKVAELSALQQAAESAA